MPADAARHWSLLAVALRCWSWPRLRAAAQDKPRYGGELIFVVPSEPPSYDGHREETFGLIHPIAPHYNTLLRIDPIDRTGTKPVGDLAESWTISKRRAHLHLQAAPGREVPRRQRDDLEGRQGLLRQDHLPARRASSRSARGSTASIEAVEAPDAHTVRFRLKWPRRRSSSTWPRRGTASTRPTSWPRTRTGTRRTSWAPGPSSSSST